jgi:hypothetical protein
MVNSNNSAGAVEHLPLDLHSSAAAAAASVAFWGIWYDHKVLNVSLL